MSDLDPPYSRTFIDHHGRETRRYHATDPALTAFKCTCGRPECTRARLLPIRDHIAALHRLINEVRYVTEAFVSEGEPWEAVPYHLMMAASLSDVIADTGYVEDPMTFALCEVSIDYEDAKSEMASKYVAGVTVFSSVWAAYEAAVEGTAPCEHRRLMRALGERGRRLLEARPLLSLRFLGLSDLCKLAEYHCRRGGLFTRRIEGIRSAYRGRDLVFAVELAREFRNHVFHGEDAVPTHPDWMLPQEIWETWARLHCFYSVGRLVLLLIQALALIQLEEGPWADATSGNPDDDRALPLQLLTCQFE